MNRAPVVGDIVTIRNKELVCVGAFQHRNECTPDLTYVFNTIKRDDLGKVDAKIQSFELIGGSILGHTRVYLTDIIFHEQIKLKTKVETIYSEK